MFQLDITQEFNTSVANLFDAWCNTDVIKRWFAPGDMTVPEASVDFRKNGFYRIVMQEKDGSEHIIGGQYKDIILNEKLVFTWQWENSPFVTTVTILFSELVGGRSKLKLTHQEFTDQETCEKHTYGWNGCLANLTNAI